MTSIPKRPSPPTDTPSIDDIVVAYLAEVHDIQVKPVTSIAPSRATNALMGAMGPAALAANTLVTQQSKAAAQQEWLHMKTFALQQPDFAEYKKNAMEPYDKASKQYELDLKRYELEMQKPEVVAALQQRKDAADKQMKQQYMSFVALMSLVVGLLLIYNYILQPSLETRQQSEQRLVESRP